MAKRLKWTDFAVSQRKDILEYWNLRNQSKVYSQKLNQLFNETSLMILKNPEIGIKISGTEARGKLVKDYEIIYINLKNSIEIISVFDTRQNPEKLKKILG